MATLKTGFPGLEGSNDSTKSLLGDGTWGQPKAAAHDIFSAVHGDTTGAAAAVLGDIMAANATPKWAKVTGNTTTTHKFLAQTGTGTVSALPGWVQPASTDISDFDEAVETVVGGYYVGSTTINIAAESSDQRIISAITQMSVTSDASGLKLSGDATTPGNNQVYGTNGSGTKGWYASGGLLYAAIAADQAAVAGSGYIANKPSTQCVITLPATAAVGAQVGVKGLGATGWKVTANTSQTIQFENLTTKTAGSVSNNTVYDVAVFTCLVANTTWIAESPNMLTVETS
jgi:hypothetical protein